MDSFVNFMAPIAIALLGFVIMWALIRMVSGKQDSESEQQESRTDKPYDDLSTR